MQAQPSTSLAAGAVLLLSVGCSETHAGPGSSGVQSSFHSYTASPGYLLDSTLVVDEGSAATHLAGVTHLANGSCLAEEAVLDARGRLVSASYSVGYGGGSATHASLDARRGTVEVSGPDGVRRVQLPNDLPWVWAPEVQSGQDTRTVSTPLSAVVTLRAAQAEQRVRRIDLSKLVDHGTRSDQLVVRDRDRSELVVVGDDVITVAGGLPRFWHVWAYDQELHAAQPESLLDTLAALACLPVHPTAQPN
jgi:hypothetical protein